MHTRLSLVFSVCYVALGDLERELGLISSLTSRDALDAHIRSKGLRDENGAIWLLVVFDNGDPGSTNRQARTVQCMHKVAFAALGLEANPGTAGLKPFAVRTGRDFHVFAG